MRGRTTGRLARAAVIAAALAAGLRPAAGGAQDVGPVKEAIAELRRFPAAVGEMQGVVQATSFGPFPMSGTCEYECFIICWRTLHWSWTPDFTWLKDDLARRYGYVSDVSRQFDGSFAPVEAWLLLTLPRFSAQLDEAAARMEAASAVITDSASSSVAKWMARLEIETSIAGLVGALERSTADLTGGIATLSAYNQALTGALNDVDGARQGLDAMIASAQGVVDQFAAEQPCGGDDVRRAYDGIKSHVRGQYQAVVDAGHRTGVTAGRSDPSVSLILGTVLNVQNQYQGVLQKLRAAEISPPGAVQQLRLGVATSAWRDLAEYARQQFGGG